MSVCGACGQRIKPRVSKAPKRGAKLRSKAHRDWIKSLPCAVRDGECLGVMHAHHVRNQTGGGTALTPGDEWCIPLCARHHEEVHAGWRTFQTNHDIDCRNYASTLARRSPHLSTEGKPNGEDRNV